MKRHVCALCMVVMVFFCKDTGGIERYLTAIVCGDAIEYRNLRIFPLIVHETLNLHTFITLDMAMDKGWLNIHEADTGQVDYVDVRNTSSKTVFLMTGEVIRGARQDRMIRDDVLIPPRSTWVRIPVYFVEHGRWVSVSQEFTSAKLCVPNALRQCAEVTASQVEVWNEIAESQARLGIASGTGTVVENFKDERIQRDIADYAQYFEKIPTLSPKAIGVIVTTGNRIICCDIFATNELFTMLWKKLIQSYVMDARDSDKASVDDGTIEDFLTAIKSARRIATATPGCGQLFRLESMSGKGSALTYESALVHMDFFPLDERAPGVRLDFRRDQR